MYVISSMIFYKEIRLNISCESTAGLYEMPSLIMVILKYQLNFKMSAANCRYKCIVKPVLSSHFKEDRKMVFETDYHLMQVKSNHLLQVKSIAEFSRGAFCSTFDLH